MQQYDTLRSHADLKFINPDPVLVFNGTELYQVPIDQASFDKMFMEAFC
jgi:hypothetical protein